jgi:nucleotide-binding universal stress UspA family protein
VRVVDTPPLTRVGPIGLGVEQAALEAALQKIAAEEVDATEYLAAIQERLVEREVVTSTAVVTGEVVPTLLGTVRPGDLLVMTTHGRTGLARWFFGSVAEAVLRRSQVPVLLVRSVAMP